MISSGPSIFLRRAILPVAVILVLGLAAAIYMNSLFDVWIYHIEVEGEPSIESLERLRDLLAERVRLFTPHFRVRRATFGVLEDGTYVVSARSRFEPSDFISALLSPNVVELREARNAPEGAEPPEGFCASVLKIPEYNLDNLPECTFHEKPIFLSDSPGMVMRRVKSVNVWLMKKLTRDPVISIEFDGGQAEDFAELTGGIAAAADDAMLALLIDGEAKTAAVVKERIEGGRVELRGVATKEQARLIGAIIEAGPLPADLRLRAERQQSAEAPDQAP